MVVAIQIWLRLRASIPPSLRRYYSLIIDPAAGQVTVVARMPTLSSPGQWITSKSENDKNFVEQQNAESVSWPTVIVDAARKTTLRPHRRARDHGTTRLASVISTGILSSFGMPFERLMQSMSQADRLGDITGGVKFAVVRSKLLHRPWMSVIEHCKLSMRPSDELDEDQREEVRFTVQSDMKASDFTPLMMTWAHFVWVCLALDLSVYDTMWHSSIPNTIKDGQGKDLIKLFEENDRVYARLLSGREVTYATHRALAWYNIAFNGEVLFPLGCGTLSQVPISSINISSELSVPSSTQTRANNAREQDQDDVVCGKEPEECDHPLAAACYWMLYRRDLPPGWITVSQKMLEYRQRILCYLKNLDEHKLLLGRLVSLVTPESHQNGALGSDERNKKASYSNNTAVPTPSDVSETSKEPNLELATDQTIDSEKGDQEEAASSITSTDDRIPDPVRYSESKTGQALPDSRMRTSTLAGAVADTDAKDTIRRNDTADSLKRDRLGKFENTKTVRILEALRSAFNASAYVQRYIMLEQIAGRSQKLAPKSLRFKLALKAQIIDGRDDLLEWTRILSLPLEQSDSSESRQRTQTSAYDLIDPKRRERFEFSVRPYIISPSACNVDLSDESKESSFMACVALALADWDDCAYQPWTARPEISSLAQQCEALAQERPTGKTMTPAVLIDNINIGVRQLALSIRENGLYTAPKTPVHDLMRKRDRNVYLL
jgi:hypothetical protein